MGMLEKDLKARAERHVARDIGQISPTAQTPDDSGEDKIEPSSLSAS